MDLGTAKGFSPAAQLDPLIAAIFLTVILRKKKKLFLLLPMSDYLSLLFLLTLWFVLFEYNY